MCCLHSYYLRINRNHSSVIKKYTILQWFIHPPGQNWPTLCWWGLTTCPEELWNPWMKTNRTCSVFMMSTKSYTLPFAYGIDICFELYDHTNFACLLATWSWLLWTLYDTIISFFYHFHSCGSLTSYHIMGCKIQKGLHTVGHEKQTIFHWIQSSPLMLNVYNIVSINFRIFYAIWAH